MLGMLVLPCLYGTVYGGRAKNFSAPNEMSMASLRRLAVLLGLMHRHI
jgi:hypothetical protein